MNERRNSSVNSTRKPSGPRRLGDLAKPILDPALRRQGFAQHEIVTRWRDIVGALLAATSVPEHLRFPSGTRRGGTLYVRVDSSFALEFQHLSTQVLERINTYYGYGAVEKLVIKQGPLPFVFRKKADSPKTLTTFEEADLKDALAALKPGPVRDSLARLGRRVLATRPT